MRRPDGRHRGERQFPSRVRAKRRALRAVADADASPPASTTRQDSAVSNRPRPHTDVQAALTVLGRRTLDGADLRGANLSRADLSRADLSRADLSRANLSWANLRGANLSKADLSEADLSEADLSEADLSEADLSEADLSEADLRAANLAGADLTETRLHATLYDSATAWPNGFDPFAAHARAAIDQDTGDVADPSSTP
jgi:uncharacterized protein YjbI with pentapeptide repeats